MIDRKVSRLHYTNYYFFLLTSNPSHPECKVVVIGINNSLRLHSFREEFNYTLGWVYSATEQKYKK